MVTAHAQEPEVEPQDALFTAQGADEQGSCHEIREHRAPRHAVSAQPQDEHEAQVKDDVESARRQKRNERRARIAMTSEDRRCKIIDAHKGHSHKKYAQVKLRQRHDGIRHVKQGKQWRSEKLAQQGHAYACKDRKCKSRMDSTARLLEVTCADILRNDDIGAERKSEEERHNESDNGHVVADCRHRLRPDEAPEHRDVRRIEHLLQNAR